MATLKELADRTGYSPATISRILSGATLLVRYSRGQEKGAGGGGTAKLHRDPKPPGKEPEGVAPGWSGGDAHPGPAAGRPLLPLS